MEVKYRPSKEGVILLDGEVKIEKVDDLNYIIKIKSDSKKANTERIVRDKEANTIRKYKPDGYARYGRSYFQSVESALNYIAKKVVPDIAFEGDVSEVKEYTDRVEALLNKILKEVGNV